MNERPKVSPMFILCEIREFDTVYVGRLGRWEAPPDTEGLKHKARARYVLRAHGPEFCLAHRGIRSLCEGLEASQGRPALDRRGHGSSLSPAAPR
jgi:hypothetical protein